MTNEQTQSEQTVTPTLARRARRSFTPEFKAEACERIRHGASYVDVSGELKIHEHLLREWTKKAGVRRGSALSSATTTTTEETVGESSRGVNKKTKVKARKRTNSTDQRSETSNEGDRLKLLADENKTLREENEILRRACRMFAAQPEARAHNTGRRSAHG